MAIQVTKSDLSQKVQDGWKKDQLAAHYGLTIAAMGRLLREAGLQIRKLHRPKYTLIDDTVEVLQLPEEIMVEEAEEIIEIAEEKCDY